MPINRKALLRYKVIDRMLRNGKEATLEELVYACSDEISKEITGGSVSRRTVQNDIQEMRYSEVLGYYVPIIVVDKKYYRYEDEEYSITKVPLSQNDLIRLSEAVDLLKQMSSFKGFDGVEDVVNRLEDHVASMRYKAEPVIYLENNEQLRGLKYMTTLHEAITNDTALSVTYKSFKHSEPMKFVFSPYILKEFRNRWFVFGHRHDSNEPSSIINLALDRIEKLADAPKKESYQPNINFDPKKYFSDIIGVTRYPEKPVHIIFKVNEGQVPYVRTKPLHKSQRETGSDADGGALFSIDVIPNRELERDLLGFGEDLTIISPDNIRERIQERVCKSLKNYDL